MDRRLTAFGRPLDVLGLDDVALDELHPDLGERGRFLRLADERLDGVAPSDQLLADVGPGEAGATSDEDGAQAGS